MKKLLAIFAVAAFVFAACGSNQPAETPATEEQPVATEEVVAEEAVTEEAVTEEAAPVEGETEVAPEGETAETPAE